MLNICCGKVMSLPYGLHACKLCAGGKPVLRQEGNGELHYATCKSHLFQGQVSPGDSRSSSEYGMRILAVYVRQH
jgi:hypothetical protein